MSESADRLRQALLDRYAIEREIGAGGMATVYLAEDLRHHRLVAVKVLRPEVAAAIGPERFQREIQVAAGFRHPHILPLYDSGEAAGRLFYITPYVPGESLRDRLRRDKRLPTEEALRITAEVADALIYAHDLGVVHRDIKPENILLERGHALVADFGIAGASAATDATRMTLAGSRLGTPAYMSPEQISGDAGADGRSDQYSLACVLYEMLAGEAPFMGATIDAVLVQRFTQAPPRLSSKQADTPAWIDAALFRAMARDPADRFPTMARFAEALKHRMDPTPEATEKSIAVLPFANLSPDAEDEFFSDGITEEIINALTQLEGIRVAARTSAFAFKGKNEDLRLIGEKLNVNTVLEGSVRKAGNRLRITAQLVNVADGYHLWSERYDRELTDVFAIQDEIALAIAMKLKVMLAGEREKPSRRGTANLEAYELFLKGRALQYRRGHAVLRSIECFEQAVALDPDYADALAWMADGYRIMGLYGLARPSEIMGRAKTLAERALAIDPQNDEAYATLADIALVHEHDPAAAFRAWDRALSLNPNHVRARCEYGIWALQCVRGALEEGVAELQRARDADPLNSFAMAVHAFVLGNASHFQEAVATATRAVEIDPESFFARWTLISAHSWAGNHDQAIAAAGPTFRMSGRHPWALGALASAYGRAGNQKAADAVFTELTARARTEYVQETWLGIAAAAAGHLDEAMRLAEQGGREGDLVIMTASRSHHWDPLRNHPRFEPFFRSLGLNYSSPAASSKAQ